MKTSLFVQRSFSSLKVESNLIKNLSIISEMQLKQDFSSNHIVELMQKIENDLTYARHN